MGGLSIWHWLIVLLVIVLVFGTKKLRNVGGDLGAAIKNFRKGMQDESAPAEKLDDPRREDSEAADKSSTTSDHKR